jgi:hypothetical protein
VADHRKLAQTEFRPASDHVFAELPKVRDDVELEKKSDWMINYMNIDVKNNN